MHLDATTGEAVRDFPRSQNWGWEPTESRLHYKRRGFGHQIYATEWIEILKIIWIELGIYNCIVDIGSRRPWRNFKNSFFDFQHMGTWTPFDQGDFVGVDTTLTDSNGNKQEWIWGDT